MKIVKGNFKKEHNFFQELMNQYLNPDISTEAKSGIKYSEMIMQLLKPYLPDPPHPDELEELLQMGIIGWNIAIVKSTGYPNTKDLLAEIIQTSGINKEGLKVVHEISLAKQKQFPEHLNLIKDFELIEGEDNIIHVNIISVSLLDFLDDSTNELADIDDMEPGFINRNAILVKPKQPFWDWLKTTDSSFEQPTPTEHVIYLIAEKESNKATSSWLKKNFDQIFSSELAGWVKIKSVWPKKRTYQMFNDFFEVEYHSMLMDLEKSPVHKY